MPCSVIFAMHFAQCSTLSCATTEWKNKKIVQAAALVSISINQWCWVLMRCDFLSSLASLHAEVFHSALTARVDIIRGGVVMSDFVFASDIWRPLTWDHGAVFALPREIHAFPHVSPVTGPACSSCSTDFGSSPFICGVMRSHFHCKQYLSELFVVIAALQETF